MVRKEKLNVLRKASGGFYSLPELCRSAVKARAGLLPLFFLFCCAAFTNAQQTTDDSPRAEIFAGYSALGVNYEEPEPSNPPIPTVILFEPKQTLKKGVNVSATGYLTRRFALTADFSAHFKSYETPLATGGVIEERLRVYNVLGGPQYKFRNRSRVTPFARGLAGVAVTRYRIRVASLSAEDAFSSTDFALALGGGVDVRVNRRIDLRVFQADYNPIFLGDDNELGFGSRADNVRFSFGIVFK
ncbi:MAG TPA: hypothetical protein VK400_14480 [Pyrinomonadaceae bacterium]|nr:hypothetical protein [Pyrinomonadaceae bacterium]